MTRNLALLSVAAVFAFAAGCSSKPLDPADASRRYRW